jgi:uroporphyrinogen-III synthase
MVIQSRLLHLLMTRPKAQGMRFARDLRQVMDQPLRITYAPLIQPVFLHPRVPTGDFVAVIFTSETGVAAAHLMPALPRHAFCVGDQTARAARKAGFTATSASGDAEALLRRIGQKNPRGRLLHICGEDTRGDVTSRLNTAGIDTLSVIAYRQNPASLTPAAHHLLMGNAPVIIPLFSPRTAKIFATQAEPIATTSLYITAFSPAVAEGLGTFAVAGLMTAATPTADAMIMAIRQIADTIPMA